MKSRQWPGMPPEVFWQHAGGIKRESVRRSRWHIVGFLLQCSVLSSLPFGPSESVWVWETWLDGSIGGSATNEFECVAVLNGSDGDVKSIQFAPSHGQWGDGDEILISAGYDDTVRIWAEDAGDWYCAMSLDNLHSDTIWSVSTSPGGGRLVSASADGSLAICKAFCKAERRAIEGSEASSTST